MARRLGHWCAILLQRCSPHTFLAQPHPNTIISRGHVKTTARKDKVPASISPASPKGLKLWWETLSTPPTEGCGWRSSWYVTSRSPSYTATQTFDHGCPTLLLNASETWGRSSMSILLRLYERVSLLPLEIRLTSMMTYCLD